MDFTGKIKDISMPDPNTIDILISTDNLTIMEELEKQRNSQKDMSIEIKRIYNRRSLDANAYFHFLVNEIARSNGKINLFSFASKYCCYHNRNLYGRDDYSILDTVLKEYLPRYFDDITKGQIQKWQDSFNYKAYNDYITKKLDECGITVNHRKRKFDHFVWYKNR